MTEGQKDNVKEIDPNQHTGSLIKIDSAKSPPNLNPNFSGAVFHVQGNIHIGVGDINVSHSQFKTKGM